MRKIVLVVSILVFALSVVACQKPEAVFAFKKVRVANISEKIVTLTNGAILISSMPIPEKFQSILLQSKEKKTNVDIAVGNNYQIEPKKYNVYISDVRFSMID